MAISEYQSEKGEKFWKAYVCIRSKENSSIRVQRWKFGCVSEKHAQREEIRLTRECQIEVSKQELKGATWGAIIDAWAKHLEMEGTSRLAETTRIDYVAAIRNYTVEWMNCAAIKITKLQVRECLTLLRVKGGSQGFQKRMKGLLNQVFVFGIESGMVKGMERSPTIGVQLDKPEEKKPEILTAGEIKKLLSEAHRLQSPWYPIWAMALLTGMRSGELYALLWSDINWENKSISVNKSFNCRMKRINSTKAGYWRSVPISAELLLLLKELKTQSGNRSNVLPRLEAWTRGYQAEELRKFCVGIGLTSIRFHALRACFATQLIQNGIPPIMVQKICGWKDLKTMQRYIRMAGIEIEGATECLKMLPTTEAATVEKASQLFSAFSAES